MDYFIYLQLPDYLAQWFVHESGGQPCELRRNSAESDIVELFLKRHPEDVPVRPAEYNVAIRIPCYKSRDIRTYNYLPPAARKTLAGCIANRFRIQLWRDLHKLDNNGVQITDLIYAWMESHGIEPEEKNWESIRQIYFRKRKKYAEIRPTSRRESSKPVQSDTNPNKLIQTDTQ